METDTFITPLDMKSEKSEDILEILSKKKKIIELPAESFEDSSKLINELNTPYYLAAAFPWLFPFGRGDQFSLTQCLQKRVKFVKHCLRWHDRRFSDRRFIFLVYNSIQKSAVNGAIYQATKNEEGKCDTLSGRNLSLLRNELEENRGTLATDRPIMFERYPSLFFQAVFYFFFL